MGKVIRIWKKVLDKTRDKWYNIKAALRGAGITEKIVWKKLKKVLDKQKEMWYKRKAAQQKGAAAKKKKIWKNLKKVLDKFKKMWYNIKAVSQERANTASWKPNNARKSNDPWDSFLTQVIGEKRKSRQD